MANGFFFFSLQFQDVSITVHSKGRPEERNQGASVPFWRRDIRPNHQNPTSTTLFSLSLSRQTQRSGVAHKPDHGHCYLALSRGHHLLMDAATKSSVCPKHATCNPPSCQQRTCTAYRGSFPRVSRSAGGPMLPSASKRPNSPPPPTQAMPPTTQGTRSRHRLMPRVAPPLLIQFGEPRVGVGEAKLWESWVGGGKRARRNTSFWSSNAKDPQNSLLILPPRPDSQHQKVAPPRIPMEDH